MKNLNRVIKFRAWDEKKKIMHVVQAIDYRGFVIYKPSKGKWNKHSLNEIMQYTGLKDKNGKEIYESDLIKNKSGRIYEIVWISGEIYCGWSTKMKTDTKRPTNFPQWEDVEVIGNIYENPELLKSNPHQ